MSSTIAAPDQAYTLTAALVAARTEEDETIHLLVADPDDPAITVAVSFAAPNSGGPGAAACAGFIESIGRPSFEGFTLLYGTARLTVAGRTPAACRGGATDPQASLRVLAFEALDTAVPSGIVSTGGASLLNPSLGGAAGLAQLAAL